MKCPKCGFNSFEYYDSCKKCSSDLISYKQTHSITPLILPLEVKERLASEFQTTESVTDQISETIETHDDIFSFDLPDDSAPVSGFSNDDPFNFGEHSSVASQSKSTKSDDVFADLLESTSQLEESPFAQIQTESSPTGALEAKPENFSSSPGEFDLESFSWEDTPTASSTPDSNNVPDDFDSLFGEAKQNTSK